MANPNVIVSRRVRIELPPGRELAAAAREELVVELDDGRRVRLLAGDKKSATYAEILSGSRSCTSQSISKWILRPKR